MKNGCVFCEIGTCFLNIIYATSVPINEMGEACGIFMREEWYMQSCGWENSGKKTTWKIYVQMVDNIKMDLKEIVWKGIEFFDLANGKHKFWDFVKTVMNFQGPIICGNFLNR